jgi:hypothetical protein
MIPVSITVEYLREHFRVVDPHDAAAQEPNKYWDPFVERDDIL